MSTREVYHGTQRKLVLAFDVGTTFSGISYSVLDPGQVPVIKGVTRFPAHEQVTGSKIPTVIYYDQSGKVRAVGAEATKDGIYERAQDENWIKAEWFKLHLRSRVGDGRSIDDIPPLPLNKTVVEVLADFLGYLLKCASSYIQDTHVNGRDLWNLVKFDINFVLSHPNGWEGAQQNEMRQAAVLAKLVPDEPEGRSRLSFVTEGEASLHYSVQNGLPDGAMKNGDGVVIVDAGGGTIDISSYSRDPKKEDQFFDEIAATQCHFHGAVFVSNHARRFLKNHLTDSPYIDDLDHIVRCFDRTTKLRFRDADEHQYIKFGSTRDNDERHNIRFGQLKLMGGDVAMFFQPSITCIVKAVLEQMTNAHKTISHVVLVGGFASSDWLFNEVHQALASLELNVVRPENHVNKAVSDGAISSYLDHYVRTRVSKVTYGSFCTILYDPNNSEHRKQGKKVYTCSFSGKKRIDGFFNTILPKNTQISETKEFRSSYCRNFDSDKLMRLPSDRVFERVWCYRGNIATPRWRDIDTGRHFSGRSAASTQS